MGKRKAWRLNFVKTWEGGRSKCMQPQLIIARLAELEGISVYEYIRRQSLYKSNEL